jgi:hypothetical protein
VTKEELDALIAEAKAERESWSEELRKAHRAASAKAAADADRVLRERLD